MMFRFYVLQLTAVYIYASGHMVCGFNESGSLEYDSTSLGDENTENFTLVWTPQIGSFQFPKSRNISQYARMGDIFVTEDGRYFQAKQDMTLNDTILFDVSNQNSSSLENPHWRELRKGTFQNPKLQHYYNESIDDGDISYNITNQKYYITSCSSDTSQSECTLEEVHVKSRWMELLHDTIKDRRICDLAIPGTHDSGSWGIDEFSEAVDGRVIWLFYWWPQTIVDWTVTQVVDLRTQLEAGYRELDLRIADMGEEDGGFVWWHTVSADPITPGLEHIKQFLKKNPYEILIIDFQKFKRPSKLKPIIPQRLTVLNELILSYLQPFMVTREEVSDMPTVGEMLAMGKNIIAFMEDSYMLKLSKHYWSKKMLINSWSAKTNPENLFKHRSEALNGYKVNHPDSFTDLSGAITMDHESISIGTAEDRSFEGLFENLIDLTRYGANTVGMAARDPRFYSTGVSVHYRGINDMYRHWLARPDLYKSNIFYVDDAVHSSTIVQTAILANLHEIKREVALTFQGSPRTGFYEWHEGVAVGGTDGVGCANISGRYLVYSPEYQTEEIVNFEDRPEMVFVEGQYPPDTEVLIQVSSGTEPWHDLYFNVIDSMINNNLDLYVRGGIDEGGHGFAYISTKYNLFGETCHMVPFAGFENIVKW